MRGRIMRLEGKLNLKHDSCDYLMFCSGRSENLSEILYELYVNNSNAKVKVAEKYSGKVIFDETGVLYKNKIQPKFYSYYVNDSDLEDVILDNIGYGVIIEINDVIK